MVHTNVVMKRSLSYLLCVLSFSTVAWAEAAKARLVITPPEGRILDDAFALSRDGESIAYTSFVGSSVNLHVRAFAEPTPWTVESLPIAPKSIEWLDESHLLLVDEQRAAVATIKKGVRAIPGEHEAIGATRLEKGAAVVLQRRGKAGREQQVRLVDPDSLAEVSDRSYAVETKSDGKGGKQATWLIGKVAVRPLTFEEGYRVLVGVREGSFDKQRDMQLPDRVVRVDLAKGRVLEELEGPEATDPIRLAMLAMERRPRPNLPRFVSWNADRTVLQLVDGTKLEPLRWDRPLAIFDGETLQSGTLDGETAWLAIKIDPLNPIAGEQKRRDPDDLEVHTVDTKRGVPERRLVLDGLGRSATVDVRGHTVAVLRRQKVMSRGGISIEVHALGKQPTAAAPAPDLKTN